MVPSQVRPDKEDTGSIQSVVGAIASGQPRTLARGNSDRRVCLAVILLPRGPKNTPNRMSSILLQLSCGMSAPPPPLQVHVSNLSWRTQWW